MQLKIIQLTDEQQAELTDIQAEIMRMFTANPHQLGIILAQIIPPAGVVRIRVVEPDIMSQLAKILPPEWADEKADYRCPYCRLPLIDADVTGDGDALWCADCAQRVEYFDALAAYEESVAHSAPLPTEPSNSVAES